MKEIILCPIFAYIGFGVVVAGCSVAMFFTIVMFIKKYWKSIIAVLSVLWIVFAVLFIINNM